MNDWLMALAVAEFCLALVFYAQVKKAHREIAELEQVVTERDLIIEQSLDNSDEDTAGHYRRSEIALGKILNNTEYLMSSFEELKAAQAETDAKVAAVKTDIEALVAKLAAVPAAGLSPEQTDALNEAVNHAKAINDSLSAVDATVNPAPAAAPAAPAA